MLVTIIRHHVEKYVTIDSCHDHGIGLSICRVCTLPSIQGRRIPGKHKTDGPMLVGYPRP